MPIKAALGRIDSTTKIKVIEANSWPKTCSQKMALALKVGLEDLVKTVENASGVNAGGSGMGFNGINDIASIVYQIRPSPTAPCYLTERSAKSLPSPHICDVVQDAILDCRGDFPVFELGLLMDWR
jgi:hypothetical protein